MAISEKAEVVAKAFFDRQPHREAAGMATDGVALTLYGNRIAEWRPDGLYVRVAGIEAPQSSTRGWNLDGVIRAAMSAGDFSDNPTTLAKLSLVPGVSVAKHGGKRSRGRTGGITGGRLTLNGRAWDGTWRKVHDAPPAATTDAAEHDGPDVRIEGAGMNLAMVRCLTPAAREWVAANAEVEPWAWMGDAFACDPRMLEQLTAGMVESGLYVE